MVQLNNGPKKLYYNSILIKYSFLCLDVMGVVWDVANFTALFFLDVSLFSAFGYTCSWLSSMTIGPLSAGTHTGESDGEDLQLQKGIDVIHLVTEHSNSDFLMLIKGSKQTRHVFYNIPRPRFCNSATTETRSNQTSSKVKQ